jgi:selenocysteine-specific elongation factor
MVTDRGAKGLAIAELLSRGGVAPEHVEKTATRLEREHEIVCAGHRLVAKSIVEALTTRLLALVADAHKRDPLAEGLSREEARERLFARADPAVFDLILSRLRDAGTLIVRDRLALSTHTAGLSNDERRAQTALEKAYREAGLTPPDPSVAAAGLDAVIALRMLELMVRQKALLRLGGLVFHPEVLAGLKADVQGLKQSPDARVSVDVATFKQRYGVSRKFAIPLLEWLDRERVTRRVGDVRVVL